MDLGHLRPETRELAALPAAERVARLKGDRWIGYGRASLALDKLDRLFRQEPGRVRPSNLLIIGPTNNGKTMIAEKFRRAHPARTSDDGEREIVPVLMVQMPAEPTVARFHGALLAALNTPVGGHGSSQRKEAFALRLLREVGTRLVIIDELHNLLAGTARRQRELLNLLRYLGNELRIPIVCLGTKDAYLAVRTDDQLENRFHPFLLPRWEDDAELGRLLVSFEAMLPLCEPSHLGSPAMRALVIRHSEGTIGEVAMLLVQAATTALLAGRERIDAASLETADYQPPSLRRRSFERHLY
jgi:Bacterial TniB protein